MNIAYIHDHKYFRRNGKVYSAGTMSKEVFSRFWGIASKITVFAYIIDAGDGLSIKSMTEIDDPRINFVGLNDARLGIILKDRLLLKQAILSNILSHDGVVARLPGALSSRYCSYLMKNTGIPIGLEVVGCTFDALWHHGSMKVKLVAIPSYLLMKGVVKRSEAVVYVTESFLQSRYPTRGKSINASNVAIGEVVGDERWRMRKRSSGKSLKLGIVGSWDVKYKGHDVLMKSLSRLPKEKFHLEIVGSGDTDYIRSLISAGGLDENVTVVGRLRPGKEMLAWFDSLNLLVHPSKQEGLPRTVIEAMSRGCPVLASSIAGIPELLPERRLHPPGDHNMLRLQLLEFLDNSEFFNEDIAMNIERSKDYLFSVLENRRIEFWRNFFQRS